MNYKYKYYILINKDIPYIKRVIKISNTRYMYRYYYASVLYYFDTSINQSSFPENGEIMFNKKKYKLGKGYNNLEDVLMKYPEIIVQ